MKINSKLYCLALTSIFAACGQKNGLDRKDDKGQTQENSPDDPEDPTAADLAADAETSGEIVTAQVDEAISIATDSAENSPNLSLALAADNTPVDDGDNEASDPSISLTRTRKCVTSETDGTATVTISTAFSGDLNGESGRWTWTHNWKRYITETRIWSKSGERIGCTADERFAAVPVKDMTGVNLKVSLEGSHSSQSTRSNATRGISQNRSLSNSVIGTREFNIDSVDRDASENYLINKTVITKVDRIFKSKRFNGDTKNFAISVATKDDAPLKVTVEREGQKLGWLSRTIKSGTIITSLKNGGSVEASFKDVRYENRQAKLVCDAVSGEISGVLRDAEGNQTSTFTIDFGDDERTITFSDGKSTDYEGGDCELSGE
jgi:hypothetical protein